jgi:hypothetical protein
MTEHERPSAPVRPGFSREDWDDRYAQAVLLWSAEPNRRFATEVAGLAPDVRSTLAAARGETPSGSPSTVGA